MKKYRDLTPEEQWEIIDNLTPQDITNGMVDHYLNDNIFWRDVEYEHPDLLSFLDNRFAIINKEYGLEKLHHLSKHHPRKKWEQSIAWYNYENNQNTNENKNMKQNKIKITENELKQIVAESVKNVLTELDWKTYKTAANKIRDKRSKYIDGEGDIWNYDKRSKDDYAKKLDNSFYDLYDAARDSLEKQFGYEDETGSLCFPILGAKGHLSFFVTILDANRNPMEYPYNEASKDLIDAYRRAKFELGNFNDPHSQTVYPNTPSNYEYKRGEGWIKKQNLSQKELGDRNSHFY